jgi:hypothetical protein
MLHSSQMKYEIDILHSPGKPLQIPDISDEIPHPLVMTRQLLTHFILFIFIPGIDADNPRLILQQMLNKMPADRAGPAGNQYLLTCIEPQSAASL